MADTLMADRAGIPGRALALAPLHAAPVLAPCQALAVAVLERLVADLRGAEPETRADARASVDGGGAAYWLACLDLSAPAEVLITARLHALAHPYGSVPHPQATGARAQATEAPERAQERHGGP